MKYIDHTPLSSIILVDVLVRVVCSDFLAASWNLLSYSWTFFFSLLL